MSQVPFETQADERERDNVVGELRSQLMLSWSHLDGSDAKFWQKQVEWLKLLAPTHPGPRVFTDIMDGLRVRIGREALALMPPLGEG